MLEKRPQPADQPSRSFLPCSPFGTKTTFVDVWRWGQVLERLHTRLAPRFARPEPRRRALAFLKGIVSPLHAKMTGNSRNTPEKAALMACNVC